MSGVGSRVRRAAVAVALACLGAAGARGEDADRQAWERTLAEMEAQTDPEKALAAVREHEKRLRARLSDTADAETRIRLAEVLVRGRLPRVAPMAQGSAAMEAIGLLQRALSEAPDRIDARHLLARTCLGLPPFFGQREVGLAALEDLVARARAAPGTVPYRDAFLLLAAARFDAGRRDEARAVVDVGLRSFPEDERLLAARAKLAGAPAPPVRPLEAAATFWRALESDRLDFEALDAGLAAAQGARPEDPAWPRWRGLLRLWLLESPGVEPARQGGAAAEAMEHFRRAADLAPADTRIDGWLGPLAYLTGRRSGLPTLAEEGERRMARGVERNPEQNRFGRAFAYDRQAASAPPAEAADLRRRAVEDLYATFEACLGAPMDRARFLAPSGGAPSRHVSCGDPPTAPHNVEGTWFFAGDVFLAAGDRRRAQDAFEGAVAAAGERGWPHTALARRRVEWLVGLAKEEPAIVERASPVSCALCHQTR